MRYKIIIPVLLVVVALVMSSGVALAQPAFAWYSGTVTVDGAPAEDGTEITVMIGDYQCLEVTTVSDGSYTIVPFVPGHDPGAVVTFYVDGMLAETVPAEVLFVSSDVRTVDLSAPSVAVTYSGTVTVTGEDAAVGTEIYAAIGETYTSEVVTVTTAGSYEGLVVDPGDRSFLGETVSFYVDGMPATTDPETVTFDSRVATADVVNLSAELASVTYSGTITVAGEDAVVGTEIYAAIGETYTSEVVTVTTEGSYEGLVVDPGDRSFLGEAVSFYVDGMLATTDPETVTFDPSVTGLTDEVDLSAPSVAVTYSATITVAGEDAAVGTEVYAVVGTYTSDTVAVTTAGSYEDLIVDPGDRALVGEAVSFYVDGMLATTDPVSVIFDPTVTGLTDEVDLTAPSVAVVYSGTAMIGESPLTGMLYARIGDEEVGEVNVVNGEYEGLVVAPPDRTYIGEEIAFYYDSTEATEVAVNGETVETVTFTPTSTSQTLDVTFPAPGLAVWVWVLIGLAVAVALIIIWRLVARKPAAPPPEE